MIERSAVPGLVNISNRQARNMTAELLALGHCGHKRKKRHCG